eukprot:CAMPEP_0172307798 /NCGR_PEP_ID=MMETSP1058-20130122/8576_1 /TAXON_ID=83371 /ORGANISM="Detonula confervacea, Strain CCMP 353" /LENGTH=250 /DNA_ID=CAMNT_0013020069 /DNA_START=70 /DNA_END=822 /DNA_ORIENTATION=-
MDGNQTWSSFEQRQQNSHLSRDPSSSAAAPTLGPGINALYVSSSSSDIAPAAATLLRHSGLTAPNNSRGSDEVGGTADSQRKDEEEFRLRFHWMRPHPSLAFSLEEQLAAGKTDNLDGVKSENEKESGQSKKSFTEKINPAVESSKLMEVYRYSQMNKQLDITTNSEENDNDDHDEDNANPSKGRKAETNSSNLPTGDTDSNTQSLSSELPKLRINLASLVEPPLMSSWLPGEDMGISYDSDDEEDDMNE